MVESIRAQSAEDKESFRASRMAAGRMMASRRSISRPRVALQGERSASLGLTLRRLEREHVALLLAMGELDSEGHTPRGAEIPGVQNALRSLLRDDLSRTQHALALAAEGRYGRCEDCQRSIPQRQLELKPTATRCAACESSSRVSRN